VVLTNYDSRNQWPKFRPAGHILRGDNPLTDEGKVLIGGKDTPPPGLMKRVPKD